MCDPKPLCRRQPLLDARPFIIETMGRAPSALSGQARTTATADEASASRPADWTPPARPFRHSGSGRATCPRSWRSSSNGRLLAGALAASTRRVGLRWWFAGTRTCAPYSSRFLRTPADRRMPATSASGRPMSRSATPERRTGPRACRRAGDPDRGREARRTSPSSRNDGSRRRNAGTRSAAAAVCRPTSRR